MAPSIWSRRSPASSMASLTASVSSVRADVSWNRPVWTPKPSIAYLLEKGCAIRLAWRRRVEDSSLDAENDTETSGDHRVDIHEAPYGQDDEKRQGYQEH